MINYVMNQDGIKKSIDNFYPAIVFDAFLSRQTRESIDRILKTFLILLCIPVAFCILISIVEHFSSQYSFLVFPAQVSFWVHQVTDRSDLIYGVFMMFLSVWLISQAFRAFYYSYYFKGFKTRMPESHLSDEAPAMTFEAAKVLYESYSCGDLTMGFVRSDLGFLSLIRSGVGRDFLNNFFAHRVGVADPLHCSFSKKPEEGPVGLADVAEALASMDQEFMKALALQEISPRDFSGAAHWVERTEIFFRSRDRFWGKDSLGKIPGIGKDWAYGGSYTLEKFAHDITEREISEEDVRSHEKELEELEAVLARTGESNVLLVAEEGGGALDVVFALGTKISRGNVLPALEHKRLYLFDTNAFIAFVKIKAKFEFELLHILNESVHSGHVIFVVSDLPNFVESAKSLGSDVLALLDPYLALPKFQMIAISDTGAFHQGLEEQGKILHRFEKVLVQERDVASTMKVLEDRAILEEGKGDVYFTYQSLEAVADGAKRYFTEGVLSDKALHLLAELVPAVEAKGKKFVERADVLSLIQSKTGIKTGAIAGQEKDTLLNLEAILHKRVVGQEEAVKVISDSMRRARSDIENPERPMGSFLFLGPTGVGKTETTKALAAVFFGNEDSIIRFDMSEFHSPDAITRLIGSSESGKAGVLSSKLREQSYGVLLLDEFEKANSEVHNLFLQILDEGFFSDMSGKKVNARNLIIVATSNAGSDLIWKLMQEGKDLTANKNEVINAIIGQGVFKPELLNRFDGVVLFHPLSPAHLQKIANFMLQKLQKRLAEKGIELVINDVLLAAVMKAGVDPQFGARPMNRAIQEKVEQAVAQRMIAGTAKSGTRVELTPEELV
ncbi:MAG: AAA family ATPase [Patescibacteria group bacterium]